VPDSQRSTLNSQLARHRRAFSLIEVVAAVGIFAIGMVAVLGLFTPVAKSVGGVADADASAVVADLLRTKLQALGPAGVIPLLKNAKTGGGHELTDADAKTDYDITKDPQLLFASRDGTKIGAYNDPVWIDPATRQPSDLDKFFEIALLRNDTLSPAAADAADPAPLVLAYTARLRWPAFVADSTPGNTRRALPAGSNPTGTIRFDHSQKQVLYFTGSVVR
jgi:prepilin-type N-terminal cleavage/methylation domain-containing protein